MNVEIKIILILVWELKSGIYYGTEYRRRSIFVGEKGHGGGEWLI